MGPVARLLHTALTVYTEANIFALNALSPLNVKTF